LIQQPKLEPVVDRSKWLKGQMGTPSKDYGLSVAVATQPVRFNDAKMSEAYSSKELEPANASEGMSD